MPRFTDDDDEVGHGQEGAPVLRRQERRLQQEDVDNFTGGLDHSRSVEGQPARVGEQLTEGKAGYTGYLGGPAFETRSDALTSAWEGSQVGGRPFPSKLVRMPPVVATNTRSPASANTAARFTTTSERGSSSPEK